MLSTRWQPVGSLWNEMARVQDEMDRWLERWGNAKRLGRTIFPPLSLWEDDDNLYVESELPGLEIGDLEIYVSGENQLTIKGERKAPDVEEGNWHRQERQFGPFERTVELPQLVDPDRVRAEFKNGVLLITLPKREEVKARKIEVKAI